MFCAGTYHKILELIAKPALSKAEIKFSTKIVKIDADKQHDGKVATITEKGEIFEFDEVVVTAPLGWLKQNESAFTPSLPARLSSAIRSIGYGSLEKVNFSILSVSFRQQCLKPFCFHHNAMAKCIGLD